LEAKVSSSPVKSVFWAIGDGVGGYGEWRDAARGAHVAAQPGALGRGLELEVLEPRGGVGCPCGGGEFEAQEQSVQRDVGVVGPHHQPRLPVVQLIHEHFDVAHDRATVVSLRGTAGRRVSSGRKSILTCQQRKTATKEREADLPC